MSSLFRYNACSEVAALVLLDQKQWPRLTLDRTTVKNRNCGKISFLDLLLETRQQIDVLATRDKVFLGVVVTYVDKVTRAAYKFAP